MVLTDGADTIDIVGNTLECSMTIDTTGAGTTDIVISGNTFQQAC